MRAEVPRYKRSKSCKLRMSDVDRMNHRRIFHSSETALRQEVVQNATVSVPSSRTAGDSSAESIQGTILCLLLDRDKRNINDRMRSGYRLYANDRYIKERETRMRAVFKIASLKLDSWDTAHRRRASSRYSECATSRSSVLLILWPSGSTSTERSRLTRYALCGQ